jgi:Cu+-exporting ATPase
MKYEDPICGMTVTDETAVSIVEWEGKTYGFCADYCHDLFMKHPKKFVEIEAEEIKEESACCCSNNDPKPENDPVVRNGR